MQEILLSVNGIKHYQFDYSILINNISFFWSTTMTSDSS